MTETAVKRPTGTAQIVWGAVLLVAAVVGIAQIAVEVTPGGLVGTLVFAALGAFLLVLGLNKRRANRTS